MIQCNECFIFVNNPFSNVTIVNKIIDSNLNYSNEKVYGKILPWGVKKNVRVAILEKKHKDALETTVCVGFFRYPDCGTDQPSARNDQKPSHL